MKMIFLISSFLFSAGAFAGRPEITADATKEVLYVKNPKYNGYPVFHSQFGALTICKNFGKEKLYNLEYGDASSEKVAILKEDGSLDYVGTCPQGYACPILLRVFCEQ